MVDISRDNRPKTYNIKRICDARNGNSRWICDNDDISTTIPISPICHPRAYGMCDRAPHTCAHTIINTHLFNLYAHTLYIFIWTAHTHTDTQKLPRARRCTLLRNGTGDPRMTRFTLNYVFLFANGASYGSFPPLSTMIGRENWSSAPFSPCLSICRPYTNTPCAMYIALPRYIFYTYM